MKTMMLILSLLALVSCNGGGGGSKKNNAESSNPITGKPLTTAERDSLQCNEDALGWAFEEFPRTLDYAVKLLNENQDHEACGNLPLYIAAVIDENPEAEHLRPLMNTTTEEDSADHGDDDSEEASEDDTYSEAELKVLWCHEDILGWAETVPRSISEARAQMNARPAYRSCGQFDLYINAVIVENPSATYLNGLLR